jgi:quercetin dioxygenase-like cupin family protein
LELGPARWSGGYLYTVLVSGSDTDGRMCMLSAIVPGDGDRAPHFHTREDEQFYVLDGQLRVWIGDDEPVDAGPGDLVHLPRGVVHSYQAVDCDQVRLLVTLTPAGLEDAFEELAVPAQAIELPPMALVDSIDEDWSKSVFERAGVVFVER